MITHAVFASTSAEIETTPKDIERRREGTCDSVGRMKEIVWAHLDPLN